MRSTGIKLPRSSDNIKIGDVLISNATHDVVVMWHGEKEIPIVVVRNTLTEDTLNEPIWFKLKEFVDAWGSRLEVKENINIFKKEK
jgi:hypothetical protein